MNACAKDNFRILMKRYITALSASAMMKHLH